MATRMELGELIWKISGDTADIKKKLDETDKGTTKLGNSFKTFAKVAVGALATIGIANLSKELIKAASDAEETKAKFNTAFKGIESDAKKATDILTSGYALSTTESQKLLSNTGDLLKGFGATATEALDLSLNVQTLAADLASYNNLQGGTQRASEILTKAMLGERDALTSLGIKISEADVQQRLLETGQKNLTGQSLLLAKSQVTLELAYAQTGDALGDMARTQDSFANQMKVAQARVEDLKVSLGNNLLPIAGLGVKTFNNLTLTLLGSAQSVNDFVTSSDGASKIGEILGSTIGGLSVVFQIVSSAIKTSYNAMTDALSPLKEINDVGEGTSFIMAAIAGTFQLLTSGVVIAGKVLKLIVTDIKNFINIIIESSQVVGDFFGLLTGKVGFKEFKNSALEAGDAVKDLFVDRAIGIKEIVQTTAEEITGFFEDTQELTEEFNEAFREGREETKELVIESLTAEQEKRDENHTKTVEQIEAEKQAVLIAESEKSKKTFEENKKRLASTIGYTSMALSAVTTLMDSIASLSSAVTAKLIADNDIELQKELEANGLAEQSNKDKAAANLASVKEENAKTLEDTIASNKKKLDDAIATGDKDKIAKVTNENAITLAKVKEENDRTQKEAEAGEKKAQIEEKYQKKKAKLEYEGAIAAWSMNLAQAIITLPLAVMNALATGFGAGFPVGAVLGPALATAAGIAGAVQIAAIATQKPSPPRFEDGGFVPGTSFSGDQILARVNSGEAVLNTKQQETFMDIANNGIGSKSNMATFILNIDGLQIAKAIAEYFNNGIVALDLERAGI